MRLLGFDITRVEKAVPAAVASLSPVDSRSGFWPRWLQWVVREPFTGAWQRDIEWTTDTVLAHWAVYRCVTLISNDMAKMRPKLMELTGDDVWKETKSPAFSPVLEDPNRYQNPSQFKQWWSMSRLLRGNTYVLKQRDERGIVVKLYILDPERVVVRVAPDGSVFYTLGHDNLNGLQEVDFTVPASEIIHDRLNCLFHPLVGISPIFACGLGANLGLRILEDGTFFFQNGSNPSGVITAPKNIPQPVADRIKEHWDSEYSGANSGKVAVLGDSMEFHPMRMTAEDSQTIEMLKFTAEMVCAAFGVPPFKIGIGTLPTYNNGQLLNQIYYSDCLQSHIEDWERCMDDGLGIGRKSPKEGRVLGVELDLDALLLMDTQTLINTMKEGVGSGIITPNEARKRINYGPKKGGDTPYMQQQNWGLDVLSEREPPTATSAERIAPQAPEPTPEERATSLRRKIATRFRLRANRMRMDA